MNLLVNGVIKELRLVDTLTGVDWTLDFIEPANHPEFKWNQDAECYEITQENFDWWEDVVEKAFIVHNALHSNNYLSLSTEEKIELIQITSDMDLDRCYDIALDWLKEHNIVKND